jgi:hypothetical protein
MTRFSLRSHPGPHPVPCLYLSTATRHLAAHVDVPLPLSAGGILGGRLGASNELITQIVGFLDEALILSVLLMRPGDGFGNRIDKFIAGFSATLEVRVL